MQEGNILHLSDATYDQEVLQSTTPILVDFWAPWCGPCRMIGPVLEDIAADYKGRIKVGKLNVDENPLVATRLGVRSIPTLLLYKGGQVVDQMVGAVPKAQLVKFIEKWLDPAVS
jgi:thioredoxin 1